MTVKANGTHAKDVALHFMKATGVERATPAIFGRTIAQVKNLMEHGYTKEEIISVIDFVVSSGVKMYSIGYINSCINDVLAKIATQEHTSKAAQIKEELAKKHAEERKAVSADVESANRNAEKARRFGVQSRIGKKFNFDMFEGQ